MAHKSDVDWVGVVNWLMRGWGAMPYFYPEPYSLDDDFLDIDELEPLGISDARLADEEDLWDDWDATRDAWER